MRIFSMRAGVHFGAGPTILTLAFLGCANFDRGVAPKETSGKRPEVSDLEEDMAMDGRLASPDSPSAPPPPPGVAASRGNLAATSPEGGEEKGGFGSAQNNAPPADDAKPRRQKCRFDSGFPKLFCGNRWLRPIWAAKRQSISGFPTS